MKRMLLWRDPRLAGALLALLSVLSLSCKEQEGPRSEAHMGDPAVAGPLTYTVIEARWRSQLQAFPTARFPERTFLLIKLSVTNSGGSEVSIPFLKLETSKGETFTEVENGAGVDGWLGVLRRVGPAQTEEGWILFDVPTNSYKLRLTDGNVEREHLAYVSIPLSMETESNPSTGADPLKR